MAEQGAHPTRLVLDTNVVVAGLLWNGPPRRLLDLGMGDAVELVSSTVLLDELARTLAYPKFAARIERFGATIDALLAHYTALIARVTPATVARVSRDPDDDHVIACALAAQADAIVSGDRDLLVLERYHDIPIVTPAHALKLIDVAQK
ncbi:MAG: putative toxin-antitoxin system toxin component, PIN family [Gammaproteobacteria bacterium]|jgi:putative PIN family toxin of toxin-antitoxin system|nr:putative toxin-antitoxin system toxin component, PIN family [Gammaproteobacteria bacterium]MBK6583932.1 putative toxin-antitoxin system toxin component, PIN family [Gammaproteobacteria bacterium]MBK7727238.1 putative toxin-antitoxin system toxin component, PIN family [Gammaproteobacteria bacterium]MBK9664907.1 putative toxin-antitoxin system toxin component, PIN family [Gammaproteobacteria bacterium]